METEPKMRQGISHRLTHKFKFIGCEILYREACFLAAVGPAMVDVEFLRKGLHDLERTDMSAIIQAAVDAVDPEAGYEAVLLGYARCNDALVGTTARGIPLVIPLAHDCITFFFGSRLAYREYFDLHPGTYYMTSGWAERNCGEDGDYGKPAYGREGVMGKLGLADSYEVMVEKYGKENADFIFTSIGDWRKNYNNCLYLPMGVADEANLIEDSRRDAEGRNWKFDLHPGDLGLLRRLFEGDWNDDFLVVPPGSRIIARDDEMVLDAAK